MTTWKYYFWVCRKWIIPSSFVVTFLCLPVQAVTVLKNQSFYSITFQQRKCYCVILPDNYHLGGTYPVLYLLHGAGGNETSWIKSTNLVKQASDYSIVMVMPDGDNSWYLGNYETYIVSDLVAEIKKRYRVNGIQGITGFSMGGFGAMYLAGRHPELFVSASALSMGRAKSVSPEELARNFIGKQVALKFDIGKFDYPPLLETNRSFHHLLNNVGVKHAYNEYEGGHDWDYWNRHLNEHLAFHVENFLIAVTEVERYLLMLD